MRDMTETTKTERKLQYPEVVRRTTKKVLTCDMCGTAGWPATEKELAKVFDDSNKVYEWGNPYDHGTICDECQETVNDSR